MGMIESRLRLSISAHELISAPDILVYFRIPGAQGCLSGLYFNFTRCGFPDFRQRKPQHAVV